MIHFIGKSQGKWILQSSRNHVKWWLKSTLWACDVVFYTQMIQVDTTAQHGRTVASQTDNVVTVSDTEMSLEIEVSPRSPRNDDDDDTQDEASVDRDQLRPLRLELTPESQLDSTEPVCVNLMDCTASVHEVLKWLTSPSWYVSESVTPL